MASSSPNDSGPWASMASRVFIFSHPRTACHVLFRLLAIHPVFQPVTPFCCAAASQVGPDAQHALRTAEWHHFLEMSDEDASKVTWQGAVDALQMGVADAELNGKCALTIDHPCFLIPSSQIQAHLNIRVLDTRPTPIVIDRMLDLGHDVEITPGAAHPNPTLLPDRFFFSFTPIITIRHPARVLPSFLRALQHLGDHISHPDFALQGESFRLERLVFDSFKEARGRNPIVIDGDKLVGDPQGQMKKLSILLGIDDTQLKYSWDPPRFVEHTRIAQAFMGKYNLSTGVFFNPRAKEVDMEGEVTSWAQEWDEDTARILEIKVAAQMEDYEYLLQFSL